MKRFLIVNISLLLLILLFVTDCKKVVKLSSKTSINSNKKYYKQKVPDYIVYDVTHYHYNEGKISVQLKFKKGTYFSDDALLKIENCDFIYYDKNGDVSSKGHANRADLYMQDSYMKAWDDIKVESIKNGAILNTSYLEWNGDNDNFVTDKAVVITQKNGDSISGIGMVTDIALSYATIKKNVKGVIKPR